MSRLHIETEDPSLVADLRAARIDGIAVLRDIQAAADVGQALVSVTIDFATGTAAALFAHWPYDAT